MISLTAAYYLFSFSGRMDFRLELGERSNLLPRCFSGVMDHKLLDDLKGPSWTVKTH